MRLTRLGHRTYGMVIGLMGLWIGGVFWFLSTSVQILLRMVTLVSGRGWMCGEQELGLGVL